MFYFAYGSNIDKDRMDERKIDYTSRQFAKLYDYQLVFNKKASAGDFTYANIIYCDRKFVEGALYELSMHEIEKLDKFEGFPNHYYREELDVFDSYDKVIRAYVYIAKADKIAEGFPTKGYLNHILKGEDIFSESYLNNLRKNKTID